MYILLVLFVVLIIILFLWFSNPRAPVQIHRKQIKSCPDQKKPVVLIIIDSLMEKPLTEVIQSGQAPALRFFSEQGKLFPRIVSSFPTMSVCIDSTLLTGSTPNEHHIFGLNYYHSGEKRIINFGTGAKESLSIGLKRILTDSIRNLNQRFLNPKTQTIHEALNGSTASINAVVYRGKKKHILHAPRLLQVLGILPRSIETKGPDIFSLGSLKKLDPQSRYDHIWQRYGQNDRFSTDELISLLDKHALPPFTIVYFPSNDDYVHQKGITETKGLEKADESFQQILNCFPSWKDAIEQITWIILGDSGQTDTIPDHNQSFVDMRRILQSFRLTAMKRIKPSERDQITCCVNERMAYIYLHDPELTFADVTRVLQQDKRIDLIVWKEHDTFHVLSGSQEGVMHFSPGGDLTDEYNQTWTVQGDPTLLNLEIKNQQITYGNYPDALFRLMSVSDTGERVIITTAAPGYEFIFDQSPKHRGASHGSLHYQDSLVPMIVAGTDTEPDYLRIINLKSWILRMLD